MKNFTQRSVLLFVAAVFAVAGLCIQIGAAPWPSFYGEFVFSLILSLVALVTLAKNQESIELSIFSVFISALFVAFILVDFKDQTSLFSGPRVLLISYIFAAFLIFLLVSSNEDIKNNFLIFLFSYFLLAGISAFVIQIFQLLGLNLSFSPYQTGRLSAFLGQPNILATFFIVSITAIFYFDNFCNRNIKYTLMGVFVFGVCLTQSRTGLVNLIFGALWFFLVCQRDVKKFIISIGAIFALWMAGFFLLQSGSALNPSDSLSNFSSSDGRLEILRMTLDTIKQSPWFGHGLGSISLVQYDSLTFLPGRGVLGYSHNLFLDLAVWSGVFLSVVFALFISYLLISSCKSSLSDHETSAIFFASCAIIFHALLEAPHSYAYLLFPLAAFLGSCASLIHSKWSFKINAQIFIIPIVITFLFLMMIFQDYRKVQKGIDTSVAYSQGEQVKKNDLMPTSFFLLDQWEYFFHEFYQPVNIDVAQAKKLQQLAALVPTTALDVRVIYLLQENGLSSQAIQRLMKACSMEPQPECDSLKSSPLIQKTVQARQAYCDSRKLSADNLNLTKDNTPAAACY